MEAGHQIGRAPVDFLPIDLAALHGLAADEDVFCHSQVRAEVDLLEHRGDALVHCLLGAGGSNFPAIECDGARVHAVNAREALDQCGFARAVFAQERVNLACAEAEIHLVQSLDAGKLNFNALHFENAFLIRQKYPLLMRMQGGGDPSALQRGCRTGSPK